MPYRVLIFDDHDRLNQFLDELQGSMDGVEVVVLKEIIAGGKALNKYDLSGREMDVLNLLAKGHSSKMIASELFISFETVRSHLKHIYHKLQVHCGKEAIAKVLRESIL